jgi:hypothetical protein
MEQRRLETRLGELLEKSTPQQWNVGYKWYKEAHLIALDISYEFQMPINKVIGVMAALSPNNKWERNLIDTRLFLEAPSLETKVCTFKGQRLKALQILVAHNNAEIESILNGRKTISFFNNILNYDSNRVVTVDLWMFRIAELPTSKANYEMISKAVKCVAHNNNLLPHQLQAIVWGVVRPNNRR